MIAIWRQLSMHGLLANTAVDWAEVMSWLLCLSSPSCVHSTIYYFQWYIEKAVLYFTYAYNLSGPNNVVLYALKVLKGKSFIDFADNLAITKFFQNLFTISKKATKLFLSNFPYLTNLRNLSHQNFLPITALQQILKFSIIRKYFCYIII